MNFSIPFGAGQEAVNAVVQRGIDAMCEQEAAGETADVDFLFDGRAEGSVEESQEWNNDEQNDEDVVDERNSDDGNDGNDETIDNNTITMEDWANGNEEEFIAVCDCVESLLWMSISDYIP
jgi:hypothetical protein